MIKKYLVLRPIVFLGVTLDAGNYIEMAEEEAQNIGIGKYLQEEKIMADEKPTPEPESTPAPESTPEKPAEGSEAGADSAPENKE